MSARLLLTIIFSILFALVLSVVAIFVVYNYAPTYLGLPPNPEDTMQVVEEPEPVEEDTVYIEPPIEITRQEFDQMQLELLKKALARKRSDSLAKLRLELIDSLENIQKRIDNQSDSVSVVRDTLKKSEQYSQQLTDSLKKLFADYQKSLKKIELIEQKIEDQDAFIEKRYDSLEMENFRTFAKIYNNSNPQDVARILEQIDERDAALILKLMSKKKAGKVLDAMMPEYAAAILLLGASE
jgi:flagellar motility protein MotE (MotC chaperone)